MRNRGSLSPEWKIRSGLDLLSCSDLMFCKIADFPPTTFGRIMDGEKDFTDDQAARLRETLDEMMALQIAAGRDTPVAWNSIERVKRALFIRRFQNICRELGYENPAIDALVADAPTMVPKVAAAGVTREPAVLSPNGI